MLFINHTVAKQYELGKLSHIIHLVGSRLTVLVLVAFFVILSTSCAVSAKAALAPETEKFILEYYEIAQELGYEYGIPWEAVMAQGILESGSGTSNFAVNRNNFFGINATSENPDKALSYSTPEEGWKGYFENIKSVEAYARNGAFDYPYDPYEYIKAIGPIYCSKDYAGTVSYIIADIETYMAENDIKSSKEYAIYKENELAAQRMEEARAKARAEQEAAYKAAVERQTRSEMSGPFQPIYPAALTTEGPVNHPSLHDSIELMIDTAMRETGLIEIFGMDIYHRRRSADPDIVVVA